MNEIKHIGESLREWIDNYIEVQVSRAVTNRMTRDRVMTKEDIGLRYGVSLKTVNNWKTRGCLPCRMPSNQVFLMDLEAMEAAGVVPGKRGSVEWVREWESKFV